MDLTDIQFSSILEDEQKLIRDDISWSEDEDHSPALEFRAEVESSEGWPLFVRGRYNRRAKTLTFALILKPVGRIYGLDMGKDHHNPQCDRVGDTHKHRWTEQYRDKEAYAPEDLTAPVSEPLLVWRQFCTEARIRHEGTMRSLPPEQMELW